MIDIRTITSNIGSVINNFDDNISILTIGNEVDNDFDVDDNINFFKIGNYEDSNYKGEITTNIFWDHLFEDLIAMDRIFDIIYINFDEKILEKISSNKKLIEKISIICFNIIDEGIIFFQEDMNLNLNQKNINKISIYSEKYKVFMTNKFVNRFNEIPNKSLKDTIIYFRDKIISD